MWVGLVDQDRANGNVERTLRTIEMYQKLRGKLRQVESHKLSKNSGLLKTKIDLPTSGPLWCPLPGASSTLERVFRLDILKPELQGMFRCLYAEEEQSMDLDVGFRGKPHIGAAAILSQASPEVPFWKDLGGVIQKARAGNEVRIFLAGSIFGGMGAAGFPTIARRLREEVRAVGGNIKISGALFLPYFMFGDPKNDQDQDVARSEAFLEQAQGALYFYTNLLRREPDILDSLYMLGWSPMINLAYHEKGGQNQVNPPMIPELYGALAGAHFFAGNGAGGQKIYHIGRSEGGVLTWDDVPPIDDDENGVKNKLGQLLRFASAYRYIYHPALAQNRVHLSKNESWFRRMFQKQGINPKDDDNQEVFALLDQFCGSALNWISSLSFFGGGQTDLDLVSAETLAMEAKPNEGYSASLRNSLTKHEKSQFAKLIKGQTSSSLDRVFERLTYDKIDDGHNGLGTFCGSLFDFCELEERLRNRND
jgi:hypothetical protein